MVGGMDEEATKRLERKIDYIAGLLIGACGSSAALVLIYLKPWGSWSEWVAGPVAIISIAYLLGQYRDI